MATLVDGKVVLQSLRRTDQSLTTAHAGNEREQSETTQGKEKRHQNWLWSWARKTAAAALELQLGAAKCTRIEGLEGRLEVQGCRVDHTWQRDLSSLHMAK